MKRTSWQSKKCGNSTERIKEVCKLVENQKIKIFIRDQIWQDKYIWDENNISSLCKLQKEKKKKKRDIFVINWQEGP